MFHENQKEIKTPFPLNALVQVLQMSIGMKIRSKSIVCITLSVAKMDYNEIHTNGL